ncbi:MAG: malto-oligosyltrehalose trehalohydrolase [Candidatus Verstraetearchaeota archaeon]|nr:malto-oligosyltrehalose trehalohydrolase [Candidatus Verstraetearchaeota archaeon]
MSLGSNVSEDGSGTFRVWAPRTVDVFLKLQEEGQKLRMEPLPDGLFELELDNLREGTRYYFNLDGRRDLPDPLSRFQPQGVHGPSEVVDPNSFNWTDGRWRGIPLEGYIIYELHVGTFASEGTFEAIIPRIGYLRDELGITAIELMPVAQFPGGRNWGYDGVDPFAPQNSYGGPNGLKSLVNACHRNGLAVILDVVYNHLGPEGNYLGEYGPYFTNRYRTPWGPAFNYDGSYSHWVRRYVIENALYWITEYHMDALRLDAIHGIFDFSAKHILEEMAEYMRAQAKALNRRAYLIAESDLNDPRFIRPRSHCGCGINAQWLDDFHHSLHALLTGETAGYYADFGGIKHLEKSLREGFVYTGEYSRYRMKPFGAPSKDLDCNKFVVFSQNHDQIGNRALGERLCHLVPLERQKLAAASTILSPYIPLLFMGEEYSEEAPFQYFVSHSDPHLIESVCKGRKEEFAAFNWRIEGPDPQDRTTFDRSKINIDLRFERKHCSIFKWYRDLLAIRKRHPALRNYGRKSLKVESIGKVLLLERLASEEERIYIIMSFDEGEATVKNEFPRGRWFLLLDSNDKVYGGKGGHMPRHVEGGGATELPLLPWGVSIYLCRD